MPLFRKTWDNQSSREPEPLPPSPPPPRKKSGFFSSRRSTDDSPTSRNGTYASGNGRHSPTNSTRRSDTYGRHSPTNSSSGGFFSRRRSSDDDSSGRSYGGSGGQEPSIATARQKVADAEDAEREAGDALKRSRNALREAKEHVGILVREALEDARRAKLKQKEAKAVGKSMKHLGRYGQ